MSISPVVVYWLLKSRNTLPQNYLDYKLTEPLYFDGTYYYVKNSGSGLDGKLCNADGSPYIPTALQYPQNGTLDLSLGRYIDTGYVLPSQNWSYPIVYNRDGTNFDIAVIEYTASTETLSIWEGNQANLLAQTVFDRPFILSLTTHKITASPLDVFNPTTEIDIYDYFDPTAFWITGAGTFTTVNDSFDIEITTADSNDGRPLISFYVKEPIIIGQNYELRLDATIPFGIPKLNAVNVGEGSLVLNQQTFESDANVIPMVGTGTSNFIRLYLDGRVAWHLIAQNIKFINVT